MQLVHPNTKEEFMDLVTAIEAEQGYRRPLAYAIGKIIPGEINPDLVLTASFPVINWNENMGTFAILSKLFGLNTGNDKSEIVVKLDEVMVNEALTYFTPFLEEAMDDKHLNLQVLLELMNYPVPNDQRMLINLADFRLVVIYEDVAVNCAEVAYLKLLALSNNKVPLRSLCLDGVFGVLTNVAWVGTFPVELEFLRKHKISLQLTGAWPEINYVDKLPRFLDHVIPADNTRILDTSKVRMGAQLAAGTVVMPGASYVNFNSGTEGPVMVEGRISSSVKVGTGSDVGGGASILGVLSGGNKTPITIGQNTLLGANSVCGISLGNNCILDAGCTILAGTRVTMLKTEFEKIQGVNEAEIMVIGHPGDLTDYTFTGKMLSGLNGVHIRQDSITGKIIAFHSTHKVELNSKLH